MHCSSFSSPPYIAVKHEFVLKTPPLFFGPVQDLNFSKIKFFLSKSQCTFLKDNRHRTEHFEYTNKTQGKLIIRFYTG